MDKTKDAERIERIRELNRRGTKAHYDRQKQKMVKGTRYCRACQKPETTVKFDDIFDRSHNIALEIYLLTSVVVSSTNY